MFVEHEGFEPYFGPGEQLVNIRCADGEVVQTIVDRSQIYGYFVEVYFITNDESRILIRFPNYPTADGRWCVWVNMNSCRSEL